MRKRELKKKRFFRGVFNHNCAVVVLYAWAYTERQAWAIMCRRIAEGDGVGVLTVMSKFGGSSDNYKIMEEISPGKDTP